MLQVFLEVVLPVALIALLGGLVGRWRRIPVPPVSALVFYLFSPALVFHSLSTTTMPGGDVLRIAAITVGTYVAVYIIAITWSVAVRHQAPDRAAFALATVTGNAGNMGLPVALLAFGRPGFDIAVVNFVVSAGLAYSVGIVIASMAGGTAGQALLAPFRYPVVYAAAVGIAVNATGVTLPVTFAAPIETMAGAAVPVMLVVLGLQLQTAIGIDSIRDTVAATVVRLMAAPAASWLIATAIGVDAFTRNTLVVLAAAPTAVIATVLATEFNARPAFVTRVVVVSTLTSMLTTTALISLLR